MTVIKFTDDKNNSIGSRPGSNYIAQKVYRAELKYATKKNLPEKADTDTLLFTTDTHEFYRGGGMSAGLIPFNTLLAYDSYAEFPKVGMETKIYLDKSSAALFYYTKRQYIQIGTGEGIEVGPLKDERVGELKSLLTSDKTSIVASINEIFSKIEVIDLSVVKSEVANIRISVTSLEEDNILLKEEVKKLKSSEATIKAGLTSANALIAKTEEKVDKQGERLVLVDQKASVAVSDVQEMKAKVSDVTDRIAEFKAAVGDLSALKTTNKGSLVAAINNLQAAVVLLESGKASTLDVAGVQASIQQISTAIASLQNSDVSINQATVNISNRLTVIESIVNELSSGGDIDLTGYAKTEDVYTRKQITDFDFASKAYVSSRLSAINIPDVSAFATKSELQAAVSAIVIPDVSGFAKTSDITKINGEVTSLRTAINNLPKPEKVDLTDYAKTADVYAKSEVYTKVEVKGLIPDTSTFVTQKNVQDAIAGITIPQAPDLSGLATTAALNTVDGKVNDLKTQVENLSVGGEVDLTDYAKRADVYTKQEVNGLIPNTSGFATQSYVSNAIAAIQIPPTQDLTPYAKTANVYQKSEVYTKGEVNALIPKVSDFATKTALSAVEGNLSAQGTLIADLQKDLNGLVIITTQEKAKYDAYEAMIKSLQDTTAIDAILSRIAVLESYHSGDEKPPVTPEPPTEPTEPEQPPEDGIEWTFDFKLPLGRAWIDLNENPEWIKSGYSYDMMEDVYGETQKVFLYYLGADGAPPKIPPLLVPAVGINDGEKAPSDSGPWYIDETVFYFEKGDLATHNYRIVKMV